MSDGCSRRTHPAEATSPPDLASVAVESRNFITSAVTFQSHQQQQALTPDPLTLFRALPSNSQKRKASSPRDHKADRRKRLSHTSPARSSLIAATTIGECSPLQQITSQQREMPTISVPPSFRVPQQPLPRSEHLSQALPSPLKVRHRTPTKDESCRHDHVLFRDISSPPAFLSPFPVKGSRAPPPPRAESDPESKLPQFILPARRVNDPNDGQAVDFASHLLRLKLPTASTQPAELARGSHQAFRRGGLADRTRQLAESMRADFCGWLKDLIGAEANMSRSDNSFCGSDVAVVVLDLHTLLDRLDIARCALVNPTNLEHLNFSSRSASVHVIFSYDFQNALAQNTPLFNQKIKPGDCVLIASPHVLHKEHDPSPVIWNLYEPATTKILIANKFVIRALVEYLDCSFHSSRSCALARFVHVVDGETVIWHEFNIGENIPIF